MTLENKTAIVTGGSRGIGRAICVALAEAGANVVTCYAHGAAGAEETVKLCEAYGVKASAIRADVAKNEDVQAPTENEDVQAPQTSDNSAVVMISLLAVVSLMGMVVFGKKRVL